VTADVDLLVYALERGYVGRPFVPNARWTEMMQRLTLLRGKATTVRELCDGVADALWQLPDAHLAARRRAPNAKTSTKCGTLYEKAARSPSVGSNFAAGETAPWSTKDVTAGGSVVGLLSIREFPFKDDPVWKDFERVARDLLRKDALIIDLRGNGGGDDARGRQLANILVDGEVALGVTKWHARKTPETLTLLMNSYATQGPAEHVRQLIAETKRERDEAVARRGPEWKVEDATPRTTTVGPKAFSGPIAILVDAACASSCESTLQFLRAHPKARVFGERTAGQIHFGDIGTFAMPNSRIRIILPTAFAELASGFHDRVGFEPDVQTPQGTDAFDVALAWR
jgi:C-terminal processing protease CtpA/Prc